MSQKDEDDFISPLLSSETFRQLENELGCDIDLTPRTLANPFPSSLEMSVKTDDTETYIDDSQPINLSTSQKSQSCQQVISQKEAPVTTVQRKCVLEVSFKEQTRITKWMNCTYSPKTETLYARHMMKVPTLLVVEGGLSDDCILCLTPRYTNYSTPLSNCPHHANNGHFIRIDPSLKNYHSYKVNYTYQPVSGHQCTLLHLKPASTDTFRLELPVIYTCMSSCQGGIHKRPFQVVYTIRKAGVQLTEKTITTWVGTCPGRTRLNAEGKGGVVKRDVEHGNGEMEGRVSGGDTVPDGGIRSDRGSRLDFGVESNGGSINVIKRKKEEVLNDRKKKKEKMSTSFTNIKDKNSSDSSLKENQESYNVRVRSFLMWKYVNRFIGMCERHEREGCTCRHSCLLKHFPDLHLKVKDNDR